MDFKQLQSFVAVVRHAGFTKAAEKLFVSQPTISAHVRALEEELQSKLIIRTTKSIEITPKGREIYDYAVSILDLKERMQRACAKEHHQIIHVGASTIPSAYILPEILPEFGRLHPDIYFSIHQSDSSGVAEGILSGIYEIGLLGQADDRLVCEPFFQDRMVLITPVSGRYLRLYRSGEDALETLLAEPFILREQDGAGKRSDQFLEHIGVGSEQLHIVARVNDQEAVKNMVAGGLGVSFVSLKAAQDFIDEKRVLPFDLPRADGRTLYLAYKKNAELSESIQEFVRFIKSEYEA